MAGRTRATRNMKDYDRWKTRSDRDDSPDEEYVEDRNDEPEGMLHMKMLAGKGIVSVMEQSNGLVVVKVHTASGNISLRGGTKAQLLAEMCGICQNLPDKQG